MSHVTCHVSHVTYHMSHVKKILSLDNIFELVNFFLYIFCFLLEGLLSTGPTLSSLLLTRHNFGKMFSWFLVVGVYFVCYISLLLSTGQAQDLYLQVFIQ